MSLPALDRNRRVVRGLLRCGAVALVAGALAAWAIVPGAPQQDHELAALEAEIAATYPHVRHLAPDTIASRIAADPGSLVIFDVREEDEFSVSRIPGARRVDPLLSKARFLAEFGADVAGRTIVFYCSVGVRSSKLAGRLTDNLYELGARGVYNLSGGIFRWHNETRALVGNVGPTPLVHPFDSRWGRYVTGSHLTSYGSSSTP